MAPMLYKKLLSPPCSSVLMAAKALDLELELIEVDMAAGEHLQESFLEKNPQHTVPVLEDEEFILVESSAILMYLASKYPNEENPDFYPEDLQLRGLIHHRLFFNGGMQSLVIQIARSFFVEGKTSIDEALVDKAIDTYNLLEKFLGGREWMVGDATTIADIAIFATLTALNVLIPIDEDNCPGLVAWIARMEELPCTEANTSSLDELKAMHEKAVAGVEETE